MAYITNKIFMTDSDMLRDKKTPYKIVLPKNPTAAEKFAAEELAHFFFQATGVKLAAAKDSSVTFDVAAHYFSVGNTSLYEKLHSNLRQDEFDDVVELVSNYVIDRQNDLVAGLVKDLLGNINLVLFN